MDRPDRCYPARIHRLWTDQTSTNQHKPVWTSWPVQEGKNLILISTWRRDSKFESNSKWWASTAHLQHRQNISVIITDEDCGKDAHTGDKITQSQLTSQAARNITAVFPCLCFQYDLMSGSLNQQQTSFLIFLKETAELLLAVLNLHLGFSFQSQQGRTKMMCRIDSDKKAVDFRKRLMDEETQGQWHRPRPLNKARAKLSRKGETWLQLSSCQTHTHTHTQLWLNTKGQCVSLNTVTLLPEFWKQKMKTSMQEMTSKKNYTILQGCENVGSLFILRYIHDKQTRETSQSIK